jgi:hypothetical protein
MQRLPRKQDKGSYILPESQRKNVRYADDCSVMGKCQVVQIAARRTGNAFIVLSTSGSEYVSVHGAQC